MNRLLRIFCVLAIAAALALVSSAAFAQGGLDLAWNDCAPYGTASRNFACNTNSGANTLFASVVVGTDMPQLNGMAGVIDMQTNQTTLSDWWNLSTCRPSNAISADFNFLSNFSCVDPWVGIAAGGVNYTYQFNGIPNRARIRSVCAIPGSTAINGTDEYYMFKVNILNAKSTGAGACAGCTDGACIVLSSIQVTQPIAQHDDRNFFIPLNQQAVTWQPGGGGITGGCPDAVPTHNTTWGSVKSLYR